MELKFSYDGYITKEVNNLMWRNELTHYGVLGMKWGVRRYQNKDGSLTSRGQRRIAKEGSKYEKGQKNKLTTNQKKEVQKGLDAASARIASDRAAKQAKKDGKTLKKQNRKNFKDDVKAIGKKTGLRVDTDFDKDTGTYEIKQWYDSRNNKVGQDYVNKVASSAKRKTMVKSWTTAAAISAGYLVIGGMINKR